MTRHTVTGLLVAEVATRVLGHRTPSPWTIQALGSLTCLVFLPPVACYSLAVGGEWGMHQGSHMDTIREQLTNDLITQNTTFTS